MPSKQTLHECTVWVSSGCLLCLSVGLSVRAALCFVGAGRAKRDLSQGKRTTKLCGAKHNESCHDMSGGNKSRGTRNLPHSLNTGNLGLVCILTQRIVLQPLPVAHPLLSGPSLCLQVTHLLPAHDATGEQVVISVQWCAVIGAKQSCVRALSYTDLPHMRAR